MPRISNQTKRERESAFLWRMMGFDCTEQPPTTEALAWIDPPPIEPELLAKYPTTAEDRRRFTRFFFPNVFD